MTAEVRTIELEPIPAMYFSHTVVCALCREVIPARTPFLIVRTDRNRAHHLDGCPSPQWEPTVINGDRPDDQPKQLSFSNLSAVNTTLGEQRGGTR